MIKKIKNILVPLDGSENSKRGLEMAIGMAVECNASITGMISIEPPPSSEFAVTEAVNEATEDEARDVLDDAKTLAADHGVVFSPRVTHGNTGSKIIEVAHSKEGFDLVIMGSRGRSAFKEMLFGSVSNYVIHESKIPVLVVK